MHFSFIYLFFTEDIVFIWSIVIERKKPVLMERVQGKCIKECECSEMKHYISVLLRMTAALPLASPVVLSPNSLQQSKSVGELGLHDCLLSLVPIVLGPSLH
jgi:hypothetical protein